MQHAMLIDQLMRPGRIHVLPKTDLHATLQQVEWLGMYDGRSMDVSNEEIDVYDFDARKHFLLSNQTSALGYVDIAEAVIVAPHLGLCVVYWD